jgi:hypothetical protein
MYGAEFGWVWLNLACCFGAMMAKLADGTWTA